MPHRPDLAHRGRGNVGQFVFLSTASQFKSIVIAAGSCPGAGIDTRKRLPSRVITHGTAGVANSCCGLPASTEEEVSVMAAAIGPPDAERKISSPPPSRHIGELPPSRETFARAPANEPEGEKERMYTSLRPDSFEV